MAQVDPDDDSVRRFIVYRYQFVPERRQHRNVAVAAFDNKAECMAFLEQQNVLLHEQKAEGLAEHVERLNDMVKEPGYARRQQNSRALFRHGVWSGDPNDLPSNVAVHSVLYRRRPLRLLAGIGLVGSLAMAAATLGLWVQGPVEDSGDGELLEFTYFMALAVGGFFVSIAVLGWVMQWRKRQQTGEPMPRLRAP